jgi:hypothetical protein
MKTAEIDHDWDGWFSIPAETLKPGDALIAHTVSGCEPGAYAVERGPDGVTMLRSGAFAIELWKVTVGGTLAGFSKGPME